jgi:hypothetical protein
MRKKRARERAIWTEEENEQLRQFASANTPTRVIALKMGRSARAIYRRAEVLGISLKPTNQSPYG